MKIKPNELKVGMIVKRTRFSPAIYNEIKEIRTQIHKNGNKSYVVIFEGGSAGSYREGTLVEISN